MTTQLAKAFSDKGITHINVQFKLAIAKFQNNGGSYEVALAMLDAAYEKGSGGQMKDARNGRLLVANASPTNDGEAGQELDADKARLKLPASPSPRRDVHVSSHDRHRPGHARRGAKAIAAVQETVGKSLFDNVMPDGRRLRDVRWNECPRLAKLWTQSAWLLMAVHRAAIPPNPETKLDAIVSEAELKSIVTVVERINAHA